MGPAVRTDTSATAWQSPQDGWASTSDDACASPATDSCSRSCMSTKPKALPKIWETPRVGRLIYMANASSYHTVLLSCKIATRRIQITQVWHAGRVSSTGAWLRSRAGLSGEEGHLEGMCGRLCSGAVPCASLLVSAWPPWGSAMGAAGCLTIGLCVSARDRPCCFSRAFRRASCTLQRRHTCLFEHILKVHT